MTIPAGYSQGPSGWFFSNTDGSGPYAIDGSGNVGGGGIPSSFISLVNSTSIPLGGGGVFTGTLENIAGYSEVRVTVFSDVASAVDGLKIEQSIDGVNWDTSDSYSIPANTSKSFGTGSASKFFRIVYNNGAGAQGAFRLQTTYHGVATKPSSVRSQDGRSNDNDFEEIASYLQIYNGASWDRQRTPVIFKPLAAVSMTAEITIWTPAAGKKFRLMGYCLESGTLGGNVTLKDNTAGTTILIVPFGAANGVINDSFGNGILSAAANNVLTAIGAATQTLSGYVYGTEE